MLTVARGTVSIETIELLKDLSGIRLALKKQHNTMDEIDFSMLMDRLSKATSMMIPDETGASSSIVALKRVLDEGRSRVGDLPGPEASQAETENYQTKRQAWIDEVLVLTTGAWDQIRSQTVKVA